MIRAIVTCFIITLFLSDAQASDDLLPGNRFKSLQLMPQLQAALRGHDPDKMRAAIKRLTHENVNSKWQLLAGMAGKVGKEISPKEDIEYKQSFHKYEFEKGTRKVTNTQTDVMQSNYLGLDDSVEKLLTNRNANDLRSLIAVLYRRLIRLEILNVALHDAPDSLWLGADYKQVLTGGDLDKAWSYFNTCYIKAWDHLFRDASEYYTDYILSASYDLLFVGYDGCLEEAPKSWFWGVWNAFRACGRRCVKTKEDKPHMYLGQMSFRLIQYAISPEFQTVLNQNLEKRIYYRPLRTKVFEVLFYSCLACRGYCKGKHYEAFWDWKLISAAKRTKLPAIQKKLEGHVARTVSQTVKRSLGMQSLADKKNELFDALARQKETLDKEAEERKKQLEELQAELNELRAHKSGAENQVQQLKLANASLKAELVALKKKYEEGQEGARERHIQDLTAKITALEKTTGQQKSEIGRLEKEIEGKILLLTAHHGSYARLQGEVQEKDVLIQQLKSARSKLPDDSEVQTLKDLNRRLREKIMAIEPLVLERKQRIKELKQEVYELKQRLNARDRHVEGIPTRPSDEKEQHEREQLQKTLARQTKMLEEQKDERSQLKEHLALAKSFLEQGEKEQAGSFLQNAANEENGENELIQRQAVHIIRIEDHLRMAYLHVQHLSSWCAYLEGGWNYTATQLSALMTPGQQVEEDPKYDVYAGGELFKLTWPEILACTKEYLREKVLPTRAEVNSNGANDNNDETSKREGGVNH